MRLKRREKMKNFFLLVVKAQFHGTNFFARSQYSAKHPVKLTAKLKMYH